MKLLVLHRNRLLPLLAIILTPALAQAHPAAGHSAGLASGIAHPLSGLDHLCAMIAVGLWAAQRGGRALWMVPLAFVSVMTIGAALGMAAIPIPFVEQGIAASVLVLGVLIAASVRLPLLVSAFLVGLFALFHGHAHGSEMAATASGFIYGLGFVISTTFLHILGIGIGLGAKRYVSDKLARVTGCLIAACGIYIFLAA